MEHVLDVAVVGVKIRQRGLSPPSPVVAAKSLQEPQVVRSIYIDNSAAVALTQGAVDRTNAWNRCRCRAG